MKTREKIDINKQENCKVTFTSFVAISIVPSMAGRLNYFHAINPQIVFELFRPTEIVFRFPVSVNRNTFS